MDEIVADTPQTYQWHEVWQKVYFHPSIKSFLDILADPSAKPARAYLWVAIMALLSGIIQGVATVSDTGALFLGCSVIVGPIAAVIGLAFGAALVHIIAGLFGGKGTFDQMVYSMGAIQAPASLIIIILSTVGLLFGVFPGTEQSTFNSPLALCLVPFAVAWSIYLIVLEVNAIRAVEKLSTGMALLTIFLPTIVVFVVAGACIALGLIPVIMRTSFQ